MTEPPLPPASAPPDALARLMAALPAGGRGPAPVERWNPPFCGDLDIRIGADGRWHYLGTPIGRPALVKLFSSVLKREGDAYFLVTPVEKIGIRVEDAPFVAVAMEVDGTGMERRIALRTNVDEAVEVGAAHPLRFARDRHDGVKPYVQVRGDLWALLARSVTHDLLALGEVAAHDGGEAMFGIGAGGRFWPIMPAREIEGG